MKSSTTTILVLSEYKIPHLVSLFYNLYNNLLWSLDLFACSAWKENSHQFRLNYQYPTRQQPFQNAPLFSSSISHSFLFHYMSIWSHGASKCSAPWSQSTGAGPKRSLHPQRRVCPFESRIIPGETPCTASAGKLTAKISKREQAQEGEIGNKVNLKGKAVWGLDLFKSS